MTEYDESCRVCGKSPGIRLSDEMVKSHQNKGRRCVGSFRPPAGDPPCTLGCGPDAGRVSWPPDLRPGPGEPMASTYVCERSDHRADAVVWVRRQTGRDGVFEGSKVAVRG
jgi:hypothetical protein